MSKLTPDQRNTLYLAEAERTGIHKPILAALYEAHDRTSLADGETGLGVSPANRISLEQVNTFAGQVQFAANTIRSLTDNLVSTGWRGIDLWNAEQGRYTDRFLQRVAAGYAPPPSDTTAARLEAANPTVLIQAYLEDLGVDVQGEKQPTNLAYLDDALLALVDRIPAYYTNQSYQREALLEALRLWRKFDTRQAVLASLNLLPANNAALEEVDEVALDRVLVQFIQQVSRNYGGLPHQREALIRLTQLWRQLDSREAAIGSLANNRSPEGNLRIIDPALIAFVQRIPPNYRGRAEERNALVEGFRVWRKLDSRPAALVALGIDPNILTSGTADAATLANTARQLDRELLNFVQRIPGVYREGPDHREALIRMVQLWRNLTTRDQTIRSLLEDVRQMQRARPNSPEAAPRPSPLVLPRRPDRWTPKNLQIYAPIVQNGSFTWAEATHGGTRLPPNQATVDAIVRIARLAQQARERIGRPLQVTSWYRPPDVNARVGGVSNSRHIVGDAIDFYCDGLTGDQIYWFLDPWWPGGLGRYENFPYLSHIDARGYRARWLR
ncbi:MAG: D-Ala-D-Ala carboxypeptidase family metallohydrolase [Leptolyngbyaceae cyanobacterium bins.59]|nr:D-Ala-D-Ala carboxypeptidase family metallohydrolase [Leptolyngbyaceae cyanobacterium bins.59]